MTIGIGDCVGRAVERRALWPSGLWVALAAVVGVSTVPGEENVYLTGVPDYAWHAGCFGTACGNLIGYWDRHGYPDFYTGPTGDGLAPLDSFGDNDGIKSLWASRAGRDGRPADQPGHEDDYYVEYESTADDPYLSAGRPEHSPDCVGDFIGLNQKKWIDLAGECDGNIDGYSFVYWDKSGSRRVNFRPGPEAGLPAIDLQSGLRDWAQHCGYRADVFTQVAEFNPERTGPGRGFGFEDLRAEIDAGYPFLVFLQDSRQTSRAVGDLPRANPVIHGMLVYGYYVDDLGKRWARVRTSWATGDFEFRQWNAEGWAESTGYFLPVRGVIGFRPLPRIVSLERTAAGLTLRWEGPDAERYDQVAATQRQVHWYVVERAESLNPPSFVPLVEPTTAREWILPDPGPGPAFYRVALVPEPNG